MICTMMHGFMNIKIRAFYDCSPLAVLLDILYKLWCCIIIVSLIAISGVTMNSSYRLQQCCVKFGTKVHLSNCNVVSFAKLQKAIISVFTSVCPYGTTLISLDRYSWDLICEYFSKICEKIQVLLKCDMNNMYLTWRPMYICDTASLNSS
jgi:hypothetical protein